MLSWRLSWLTLTFALLLAACSGLGGEPKIVATVALSAPPAATAETGEWPPAKPNITEGARIFAEHCTDCHGLTGDGKGELVLAGSVPPPLDMTRLELTAQKRPQDWYEIITEGNLDKLMPPWRNALTQQQRWDAALYAYSLAYRPALLEQGERVWLEKCAECSPTALMSDMETALTISDVDVGLRMNREDFDAALNADETAAAVAYARLKWLTESDETATASPGLPMGNFTGQVRHGTAGGLLPRNTLVQMQYGNAELGFSFAETSLNGDNSFSFDDIPLTSAFTYQAGAVYEGRLFSRRRPAGQHADTPYHLDIAVYDLTNDPTVVSASRIDMLIEAIRLDGGGTGLLVSQIIGYRNSSDRVYASGRGFDDGRDASLLIQFPAGARILSGDENGRYVIVEDLENVPDSVIDTQPVFPGDVHQVIVEYYLPYANGLVFEQAFSNMIQGEVTVSLSQGLSVIDDWLSPDAERGPLPVFSGRLDMDENPKLSFEIRGDPFATSSGDRNVVTSETLPQLGLGIGGLIAVVMAGIFAWAHRRKNTSGRIDSLARQIAQLDKEHDQGDINHDVYQQKRRTLKEELGRLMHEEADG